ncbi:MAG: DUF1819 family protein [Clostridia bacterium]|nr:DUF1819 family protein [Clostridia bacterium]MBR0414213.1 DUF1819 family protein [Clostridia bacterium]
MPAPQEYKATITREKFLYFETRVIAKYKTDGYSDEEIIRLAVEENLLQMPTEKSSKLLAAGCLRKLNCSGEALTAVIANAPSDIAKQANLYAMMNYNRLVWDFMILVIGRKFQEYDLSFGKKDVNAFFSMLQEQNPQVAEWSESTIQRIRNILVKMLVDTGYLDEAESEYLNRVFLFDEVKDIIIANADEIVLPAFNCFI